MAEAGTYGGCCGCPDVLPLGVYEQHRVVPEMNKLIYFLFRIIISVTESSKSICFKKQIPKTRFLNFGFFCLLCFKVGSSRSASSKESSI